MPVRGTVKWFSSQKGYGFITCEGRDEVFAHYSDIVDNGTGFRVLERGTEVEFELIEGERGPRARHIVKLKGPETEDQEET